MEFLNFNSKNCDASAAVSPVCFCLCDDTMEHHLITLILLISHSSHKYCISRVDPITRLYYAQYFLDLSYFDIRY